MTQDAAAAEREQVFRMQEIKCPNCGEVFVVDESGYAQIVQQVRDREFEKELQRREKDFEEKKESELKLAQMAQKEKFARELSAREAELFEKEKKIGQLMAQISENETEKKLAVREAVGEKEKELSEKMIELTKLKSQLSSKMAENELKQQSIHKQYEIEL